MSKIRVSNLAEKLGIDIRETLARLKEIGVEAKSSASLIEEDAVKKLLTPQPKEGSASTDEVRVTTNIIRRRAKAVPETVTEETPPAAVAASRKRNRSRLWPRRRLLSNPIRRPFLKRQPGAGQTGPCGTGCSGKAQGASRTGQGGSQSGPHTGPDGDPGVTTRPTRVVTKETPPTPRTAPARPAPEPAPRSGGAPAAAPAGDQDRSRLKQVQLTPAAPSGGDSRRPGGKKEGPGHGPDAGKRRQEGGAPAKKKEQPKY